MSTIRILCIGDQHFQVSNLPQVDVFYSKLLDLLCTEQYDIIVSLGDLLHLHERLHTLPLRKATEYLDLLRSYAPTFVLVGNHDYCNNSQFLSDNHWLNSFKHWKNITIVDEVIHYTINDIQLTFLPYVPDGRFVEALDTKEGWKESLIIFAHQQLTGVKMGAIVADCEEWDKENPLVISGHIHEEQKVQNNLYYTGSSMQHAFGECANKVVLELQITNGQIVHKRIDLDLPKKEILYLDIADITELDLESLHKDVKYKISVTGDTDQFKAFTKSQLYRELLKRNIKVVFKNKRSTILAQKEGYMKALEERGAGVKIHENFADVLRTTIDEDGSIYLKDLFTKLVLQQEGLSEEELDGAEIEI